jgi:ubiquinone/menaquinone biosynthesis C-methylase UbiE
MSARSIHSHGQFFIPHLTPGVSVLDCGCGPGSITLGIAELVAPGQTTGVDFGLSQIEHAQATAANRRTEHVTFQTADCYSLPFADHSFDRVFSHALMEHLADPRRAASEMYRVLKPGGVIGVCGPDWGGFVLAPSSRALDEAIEAYTSLQTRNGGDIQAGRKLGGYLKDCGFKGMQMSARYECYASLPMIGEYLALQLEQKHAARHATTLRQWSQSEAGMFAQCWVSCVAHKE